MMKQLSSVSAGSVFRVAASRSVLSRRSFTVRAQQSTTTIAPTIQIQQIRQYNTTNHIDKTLPTTYPTAAHHTHTTSTIVTCDWLAANLPYVRVIDGSWFMPNSGRDAQSEYEHSRIIGARRFDIDACRDKDNLAPHMLPNATEFERYMGCTLGIRDTDHCVVYDSLGIFSAPRVWFTLRAMGHKGQVSVLSGGLPAWRSLSLPVARGIPTAFPHKRYTAHYNHKLVATYADVMQIVNSSSSSSSSKQPPSLVLDARSPGRFNGSQPEPRAGLSSGHMPHSQNLFFQHLLHVDAATGVTSMKSAAELQQVFSAVGVDVEAVLSGKQQPITATCGTGVTASVIALALDVLTQAVRPTTAAAAAVQDVWRVYDGSWSEYAANKDSPIVKGQ